MYKVAEGWKDDIPQTHSSTQIWGAKVLHHTLSPESTPPIDHRLRLHTNALSLSLLPLTPPSVGRRQRQGLAIFFLVLAGLWLCLLLFLRKSINLAIGLVIEAAKALETMPLIVLYPVAQVRRLHAWHTHISAV